MGSELELRLCQNLTNLAKFQLREKVMTCPSTVLVMVVGTLGFSGVFGDMGRA